MKSAIDQMIDWLESEMASYPKPASYIDKGYRAIDVARTQALKIKERCDADASNDPGRLYAERESKAWPFEPHTS